MKISAGILAGGKSSRMGRNKALIKINNERIIDRLSKELSSFDEVIISAACAGDYEDTGLSVVYDENKDKGPIEGIRQVLSAASSEYVFICAADMPFISKELVSYLADFISSDYDCYVITDEDRIQPLCAIYSKRILPVIEKLIKEDKCRLMEILNSVRTKYISIEHTDFDKKTLKNINTKEELIEAVLPVYFCVSGYSDSGKTGLIVRLINEFKNDGYSVNVLKHSGCGNCEHKTNGCRCDMDVPGSDTDRFSKAGAISSGVYGRDGFSLHVNEGYELSDILKLMDAARHADIFIIEGLKSSDIPKVDIIGDKDINNPHRRKNVICTVTDIKNPPDTLEPIYALKDTKGIYLCLKEFFGLN